MNQFEVMQKLADLADRSDAIVVSDIGSQSMWLAAAKDRAKNFYLTGPMGASTSVALGLALARPEIRVICVIGDGGLLMNLSSLVTAAAQAPKNLAICVIDNGVYNFTGNVELPGGRLRWTEITNGIGGFDAIYSTDDMDQLFKSGNAGLFFIHAFVEPDAEPPPRYQINPAPEFLKIRKTFS